MNRPDVRTFAHNRLRLPYRSFRGCTAFCVHTCMVLLACRGALQQTRLETKLLLSSPGLYEQPPASILDLCSARGPHEVECFCLAVQVQPPSDRAHAMLLSGSCSSLDLHDTVEHSRSRWQSFHANPLRKSATLSSNLQTMAAHYYDIPVGCNRSQQGTRAWISSVRVGGSYSARCRKSGLLCRV